jgi:hypothetical protein
LTKGCLANNMQTRQRDVFVGQQLENKKNAGERMDK